MTNINSKNCVVAIDIGASSGRLIACFLERQTLQSKEIHRFENSFIQDDGNFVWDIPLLCANMFQGLKNNDGLSIKSIGVDMWGVDYVLVDDQGAVLDKAFAYRDPRTDAVYEKVMSDLGKQEIYNISGIQFMSINTLYQIKAHMKENADVFLRAKYILMLPDYFHYRLCGVFCNEFTEATTSQMVHHKTKIFDATLLTYLGISPTLFPPMVQAGHILGTMHTHAQRLTGLGNDVKVIAVGSHDTASAVASFIGDSSTAYIISGTWSVMGDEIDRPIVSDMAMKYNFANEGGVYGTNTLLKNIMGMWIINCVKSEIAKHESFDVIAEQAQEVASFQTIINPTVKDFLNPPSMTRAIQSYAQRTRQKVPKTIGEFARCIYESLALEYNKTLSELEHVTHKQYRSINIIGGGSQNRFLNQLTANITQRHVIAGPVETSSIGNIVVQMISLGWIKNIKCARDLIKKSETVVYYNPKNIYVEHAIHFFNRLCDRDSDEARYE